MQIVIEKKVTKTEVEKKTFEVNPGDCFTRFNGEWHIMILDENTYCYVTKANINICRNGSISEDDIKTTCSREEFDEALYMVMRKITSVKLIPELSESQIS